LHLPPRILNAKTLRIKCLVQRLIAGIRFLCRLLLTRPPQFSAFRLPAYHVLELKNICMCSQLTQSRKNCKQKVFYQPVVMVIVRWPPLHTRSVYGSGALFAPLFGRQKVENNNCRRHPPPKKNFSKKIPFSLCVPSSPIVLPYTSHHFWPKITTLCPRQTGSNA
jgi:hypothetical protein